jgi:osmotically-inducible protein OsmY
MDPQHWDLVINTGRFSMDEAVTLVASIVEGGMLDPSAADRQRLSNLVLASRVETAVLNDPSVWVNGLKVVAQEGRVHLEGEVLTEDDREAVEQVARAVEGVRLIDNDLRVQPPPLTGM